MKKLLVTVFALSAVLLLAACGDTTEGAVGIADTDRAQAPTDTPMEPQPTYTPLPPQPTYTPYPTEVPPVTNTPAPASTQAPASSDSGTTWVNPAPTTGFEVNTNFVQASTCGEPETEVVDGVEHYVIETDLKECPDGMYFQTGKLGQVNVKLIVRDGQAAHVDGYDVSGRPGVFKGFGPGTYNLTVSDGAVKLGSTQDANDRHCEALAIARANSWLIATVEPLAGWTCS